MAIRPIYRDSSVLKLVHRGGRVELHKNPITAAEVMKRNPRHCVTRPDVFEFPWIVVRPESVLKPGRVFLIVPNHTIHRLLQSKSRQNDDSVQDPRRRRSNKITDDSSIQLTHFHQLMKTQVANSWQHVALDGKCDDEKSKCHFPEKQTVHNPTNGEEDTESDNYTQLTNLKSCLKKQQNNVKSRNLKVKFVLPMDDKKDLRSSF